VEVEIRMSPLENLKGSIYVVGLGIEVRIILKRVVENLYVRIWARFTCLRMWANDKLVSTR